MGLRCAHGCGAGQGEVATAAKRSRMRILFENVERRARLSMQSPWWRCYRWYWAALRCGVRALAERLRRWQPKRLPMGLMRTERWTSPYIERACARDSAQATIEAAVLLPSSLILMLVLLQPVCVLYTRAVMESAAAQTARLMVTAEAVGKQRDEEAYRAFALRRLAAVPDVSIFHVGGPYAWEIAYEDAASTGGEVRVAIEGALRPLPILGIFARGMGEVNGSGDVVVRVEVSYEGRPGWLSGGNADEGS